MKNRDKSYLIEELSREEKSYLKKIVLSSRNRYIEKNDMYLNNKIIELNIDINIIGDDPTEAILEKEEEFVSEDKFEDLFTDEKLRKIAKALSLKEKRVLFAIYRKKKNISVIARELRMTRKSVRQIRDRAKDKILKKIMKGD